MPDSTATRRTRPTNTPKIRETPNRRLPGATKATEAAAQQAAPQKANARSQVFAFPFGCAISVRLLSANRVGSTPNPDNADNLPSLTGFVKQKSYILYGFFCTGRFPCECAGLCAPQPRERRNTQNACKINRHPRPTATGWAPVRSAPWAAPRLRPTATGETEYAKRLQDQPRSAGVPPTATGWARPPARRRDRTNGSPRGVPACRNRRSRRAAESTRGYG